MLILASLILSLSPACSTINKSARSEFALKSQNGKAVIEIDNISLIFDAVDIPVGENQNTTGARGHFQADNRATSINVNLVAFGKNLQNIYKDGVNTLLFEGYTITFTESRSKMQIGNQSFNISDGKTTYIIPADGNVRIQY